MKLVSEFLGYLENAKKENEESKLGWTAGTVVADASLITFIIYHLTVAVCVLEVSFCHSFHIAWSLTIPT